MKVLLCVSGGIAAYKACEFARLCVKAGHEVRVAMTPAAQKFVGPLTFEAITHAPVAVDTFAAQQHISLSDWAEVAVLAPATADVLGRLAHGLADDVVTTTLLALEPRRWIVAPAMNEKMWASAAVAQNVQTLRERGARIVGPAVGEMAERGHSGAGRMVEPAELFATLAQQQDLSGVKVLVTAGPTREHLDPVRFISNPSTGKMGFAIAQAAQERGAHVILIAGPTEVAPPQGVQLVRITTAEELRDAVERHLAVDVVVMTAAVADQKPREVSPQKVKKKEGEETLVLVRTPDILAGLGARAQKPLLVGFAAESENVEANARDKLARKHLDFIVANDVSAFGSEQNKVLLLDKDGGRAELSGTKVAVAHGLWDRVRATLRG